MPQQVYPGQNKFRVRQENVNQSIETKIKQVKRRADTQKRMVKLRQSQSTDQITNANILKTQWRKKQKQQQQIINNVAEQKMLQIASERYAILYYFILTNE